MGERWNLDAGSFRSVGGWRPGGGGCGFGAHAFEVVHQVF